MSIYDQEEEEGTEEGVCPFTVHGITGDEYSKLSMTALKARAIKHLEDQGKTPQMFPWLFPYGYGGIGQARLKKKMSVFSDRRF